MIVGGVTDIPGWMDGWSVIVSIPRETKSIGGRIVEILTRSVDCITATMARGQCTRANGQGQDAYLVVGFVMRGDSSRVVRVSFGCSERLSELIVVANRERPWRFCFSNDAAHIRPMW